MAYMLSSSCSSRSGRVSRSGSSLVLQGLLDCSLVVCFAVLLRSHGRSNSLSPQLSCPHAYLEEGGAAVAGK